MIYSETFKIQAARRLKKESTYHLSRELGIPESTLRTWRDKYGKFDNLDTLAPNSDQFDRPSRFMIVVETISMTEEELADYAGRKGILPDTIKEWKREFMDPECRKDAEIASLKRQLNEEKCRFKKEMARKDKVIAEMTAIAIMQKKAMAIWGEKEEE